jgi:cytochrome bd-type quinol oxidase subunit 1
MNFISIPGIEAKWVIAFFGLFHTSVAAMSIGVATVVTIAQIVAYKNRNRRYDQFAKRSQLFHVCIYNVGTINAIGLVFALSGLFPQFWEQIFVHLFWTLMAEEFLFLLLATTVTFHYFFWEHMWGHKKLHIVLGALLTPLFFLQHYIINGMGAFMLTPGFAEGQASIRQGILGWDKEVFYNPSFLMLHLHRSFANVSYAAFLLAGWCGFRLFTTKDPERRAYYEENGRLAFYTAFAAFLSLPVIGYFYSHVLQFEAPEAFEALMFGTGDVFILGADMWWVKHGIVAAMIGIALMFYGKQSVSERPFSLPRVMIFAVAGFYLVFYIAMGMVMTWAFFWVMLGSAIVAALLASHQIKFHKGSGRAVFVTMGLLAFFTVLIGGYVREASRPRFVDRIAHYDQAYVPNERQSVLLVDLPAERQAELNRATPVFAGNTAVALINERCTDCHTLDRVRNYPGTDWRRTVHRMMDLGARISPSEAAVIIEHLDAGKEF